jgi:putative endonuclease
MNTGIDAKDGSHTATGAAGAWHVYILLCADGTLYTGCTTDVDRRLREHNGSTRGARYTRSRRPVSLLRSWPYPDRSAAQREEARIKRLPRDQKLLLTGEQR